MCERKCDVCIKIRFVKPEEDNGSFCVTMEESHEVEYRVREVVGVSTTHKEKVEKCDHPEEFVQLG